MTHKVTVTFDIEANSPTHAVQIVEHYLAGKGVHEKAQVELTCDSNGETRTEPRFGYSEISTVLG